MRVRTFLCSSGQRGAHSWFLRKPLLLLLAQLKCRRKTKRPGGSEKGDRAPSLFGRQPRTTTKKEREREIRALNVMRVRPYSVYVSLSLSFPRISFERESVFRWWERTESASVFGAFVLTVWTRAREGAKLKPLPAVPTTFLPPSVPLLQRTQKEGPFLSLSVARAQKRESGAQCNRHPPSIHSLSVGDFHWSGCIRLAAGGGSSSTRSSSSLSIYILSSHFLPLPSSVFTFLELVERAGPDRYTDRDTRSLPVVEWGEEA